MTQKESDMLREIAYLINECPGPNANIYSLAGYIESCKDYQKINDYVFGFLYNYSEYIDFKQMVRDREIDEEDTIYFKNKADESLQGLRNYIKKRKEEHWS